MLKLKRVLLTTVLLLACHMGTRAQYDPSYSHYWTMPTAYNPAATGRQDKLNVVAGYTMSMVGFKHNPRTMNALADMPFYALGAYHGVGLQMVNDQIGLFSHQRLALQYSYKHRLLGGRVSVGVQGGLLSENWDGTKLDAEEAGDPALASSSITGSGLDVGAGLFYQRGPWYVGLSAQHLNQPKVELGETNELNIDAAYYFTAGYNIRLRNPFLTMHPSLFARKDGAGWRADATCRLVYQHEGRVMYAGVGYSPDNSATVYLGGMFHGVMLGYSYEMYTSAINPGNGSHELVVVYQTDLNLYKKGRNRHQAVRIL